MVNLITGVVKKQFSRKPNYTSINQKTLERSDECQVSNTYFGAKIQIKVLDLDGDQAKHL